MGFNSGFKGLNS